MGVSWHPETAENAGHSGCNSDPCSGVRALGEGMCFSCRDYVLHCWLDTTLMEVKKLVVIVMEMKQMLPRVEMSYLFSSWSIC